MKFAVITTIVLLATPALAQPVPTPVPPVPTPTPAPTPTAEAPSWLPGILTWNDPAPASGIITLDEALAIALLQQPSLRQSRANIEIARGRVELSKVARKPTVNLNASASAGSGFYARSCFNNPALLCGGFLDPTVSTGLGAQANWRITDFGQTSASIRAAEASAAAAVAGVDTTLLDIRSQVESSYLEAVARARLIRVAAATVKSEEAHLDQARRFVAAQAKDPIEVAQAQARTANARSALAQAQSNEAIALAELRASIGWIDAAHAPAIDPSWPEPPTDTPLDLAGLVEAARTTRPELVQYDKQIIASEANLDAANAERRPVLNATGSTQWGPGTGDWSPPPSWSVGITLSWSLFDGGRAKADQRIARANLQGVLAQRDALLVDLTSQLDSARAQIVANRANVIASTEAVEAARRQLQLADARYAQGLGSQIELADAQTAITTAEGNLVLAQFQLATAWVQLRRALGRG